MNLPGISRKISLIITIGALLIIFIFYWFQLRPANIKKECWRSIEDIQTSGRLSGAEYSPIDLYRLKSGNQEYVDDYYKNCLREKGL